jgi:hypothetical protein
MPRFVSLYCQPPCALPDVELANACRVRELATAQSALGELSVIQRYRIASSPDVPLVEE